jgi:hypothetical protein
VLEARERIGGRILSEPHVAPGAAAAELGAEFIHGTSPPISHRCDASSAPSAGSRWARW